MKSFRKLQCISLSQFLVPTWIVTSDWKDIGKYKHMVTLKSTLNTELEGDKNVAFLVKTTTSPVKLKQRVPFLTMTGIWQTSCYKSFITLTCLNRRGWSKLAYCLSCNRKSSLYMMLHQYHQVIGLLKESVVATNKAGYHIKLQPETKPVYIPAHRLLQNLWQIVDEQVKDIISKVVFQPSRSPLNSALFLEFRHVIDFRRVNEVTENDQYAISVLSDLWCP